MVSLQKQQRPLPTTRCHWLGRVWEATEAGSIPWVIKTETMEYKIHSQGGEGLGAEQIIAGEGSGLPAWIQWDLQLILRTNNEAHCPNLIKPLSFYISASVYD